MKTLHSADWHVRDKDIEEAEKHLSFLVETARYEVVDLVVIAGDLFDSQDVRLDSKAARLVVKTVSELADIAPVAIVLGTPSHDGKAAEILEYIQRFHAVWVLSKPDQLIFHDGGFTFIELADMAKSEGREIRAVLSLIPTPTKQYMQGTDQEISAAMNAIFAGFGAQASQYKCPHVLVSHLNVTGAKLSNGQLLIGKDIETTVDQLMFANPDLTCLGHIHYPQALGKGVFYSGSLFPVNWGEDHKHGFYIHEIDGQGKLESRFVETACRKLVKLGDDFVKGIAVGDRSAESIKGSSVRLDVTVYQDDAATIDKEGLKDAYLKLGALDVDIRIIRVPRENIRAEAVLKAESLKDKVIKMAELRDEKVDEGILVKADMLEESQAEEVIRGATE